MYWKVWEHLNEASKEEARTVIHDAASEKGNEGKTSVTARATETCLEANGDQTYRIDAYFFFSFGRVIPITSTLKGV